MKPEWFGGRLRELRERAGMTQRELAEAAGLNPGAVCDLEHGRKGKSNPTWQTVVALCKVLAAMPGTRC